MPTFHAPSRSLDQSVAVETPELVVLTYTVAGLGSRALAAIVDTLICAAILLGAALLANTLGAGIHAGTVGARWSIAIVVLAQFVVLWGWYVLWEGLADGQTPGKRWMRLRVVRDSGHSVDLASAAARNLVRIVDMQPVVTYGVGMVSVLATRDGRRLGDLAAGTIVVREALVAAPAVADTIASTDTGAPPPLARLSDEELSLLDRWVARRDTLAPERRAELARALTARLATALAAMDADADARGGANRRGDAARLLALHASEHDARARGGIARGTSGAARERHAIVAASAPRWRAFAARLALAQRRGLAALGEDEVRQLVADYRAAGADLARLRTAAAGVPREELFYLGRLVAGAHNLLYRGDRLRPRDAVRALFVDAPREVRRSWRPILLAALLLFGPLAIAWTAVVRHPSLAPELLPAEMLDRADDGVRRARSVGEGYVDVPELYRPLMASRIIANNVQVTYGAFATGIAFGVGTVFLLVFNGVSFGAALGLYQSKGILPLIGAFVAPHGVLELSAICIASAGGLLLGAALLMPGGRTRRRALVEEGRRAMRLLAASTFLLVAAGTLEGLVSPIPWWPLEAKLAVSGITAALLWLYLRSGAGRAGEQELPDARGAREGELLGLGE